ncbi:MAG: RND transporter [Hyphomicrobium sp.]|nr:MAG: RND transporter [Hyphomicrobium sp.]
MQSPEPRRSQLFFFGLDKLGLIALKAPYVSAILIAIVTALAAVGVSRLTVDDSLSELFRTNTPEFRQYEEIDRRFPSSEYDVLVVVEGQGLLTKAGLEAFSRTAQELQLVDGVSGLVSMLSARGKPDASGYAAPIVPDELPEGAAFEALMASLKSNDIVKGKFLSDDGTLALIVIALDRAVVTEKTPKVAIGEIKQAADEQLQGSGLSARLTGAPVMQLEIRNAVERDRLVYNGLGFLAGFVIAYLFFRRLSLTLIAVLGPSIAILWTLGVLGSLDYRLNLFINVITPLILVSGFSDSMHLVFAIRRDVVAGVDRLTAARNAVRDVAPACLLTAMNAALALISFSFAESALIRTFGQAALMAVGISYLAVAIVVPTLAVFLIQKEEVPKKPVDQAHDGGIGFLHRLTTGVMRHVIQFPASYTIAGILAVIATGYAYVQLQPMYRLADQVPDKEQALEATGKLDQKLTGANPVHVMISWKGEGGAQPVSLYDSKTLDTIADVHRVVENKVGLGNVWSIDSLRRWLKEAGDDSIETVKKYVGILPEHLVRRFIAKEETAVLVTARVPDVDASEILPVVDRLDRELQTVREAHPGYEIAVTGLPAIAARNSAKLIGELNWGLVGDMFVIFIFLAIMLRSVLAGVTSILPSVFPIFATGALLWLAGEGLQFASIIAITVAFALAIDSTIHFQNRFRIEEGRPDGGTATDALLRTVEHIGPAVVLTTIVLALGLGVTMLSHLPSLRRFGELSAVCLLASLLAQLIILPASIALYRRHFPRRG